MKVRVNFNNRLTTLAGAIAITLCSGASANPPASSLSLLRNAPAIGAAAVREGATGPQLHLNVHAQRSRYTVILKDEPVATYDGLVSGYPKISRSAKNGRLDVKSKEAVNYANYLVGRQDKFLSDAGTQLKRPLDPILQFQHAVNGVVVELTAAEAAELAKRDDVLLVDEEKLQPLLTNRSTFFIGADKIWDGSATGGLATQGEGIVIGDIDSGINFTSPSFASPGPVDGYVYANPLGAGNYLGLCRPGNVDEGHCNDKLIGLYDFVYSICSAGNSCGTAGTWTDEPSATDSNGHGSHTASTAAGNHANVALSGGNFTVSGVAPHASIVAYDVCYTRNSDGGGLCPTTSTTNAANQAVADGIVDVLTFSIGGGTSPWTDSTSLAFLGAQNAGIFVVAAAGNDGPAASTVSHVEPWVATAAASTDDQVFGYTFNLNAPGTPPAGTVNLPVRPGANPQPTGDLVNLPITQSPGFANGNNDGCTAFASAHTFDRDVTASERIFGDGFEGTTLPAIYQKGIAVLHLDANNSGCGSVTRRGNALNAGAAATIFVDNAYINLGASDTSYSMIFTDWNNVLAQINTDPANATASVQLPLKSYLTAQGDVIADFSSRGPAAGIGGQAIVKPEVAAPGVAILAAYMGDPGAVALEDGTSMSTPHIAGSAALLRALHPEWSPTQIRSAMMMTAKTDGVVKQDGSPAGIWERGSGRVDLAKAAKASLLFDETGANFTAANPASGGKIATLNLPSIADSNCIGACNYSRTVKGAHAGAATYALSVDGFGGSASVAPASMTVSTGGTKTFTVTVHGDQLTAGQYTLGQVTFTPSDPNIPVQHMPVAVKPGGPVIQLSANSVAASQDVNSGPTTKPLTITNIGNPTLNWSVATGNAPVTVMNTATTSNGELGGYYNKIPAGSYLAQNFDVTGPVRITKLSANGFVLPSGSLSTTNTPGITFKVYADNAGVPDGSPGDPPTANNGNAPIFSYTNTIGTANGITTTSGVLNLDLTKAGVPVLNLTAGRYWLVVAPNINSNAGNTTTNPLWAWRVSSDPVIGNSAQIIGSLWGLTNWEDVEATPTMLSTIVSGTVDCTKPSWVNYAPTSDALGYNASTAMTLTFDPTGLTPGNYAGNLCIGSNATNAATAVVSLSFAVTGTLTHKVTPSVGTDPSWGTISPDTQQTVNDGATTQFTLSAASGYHIDTVGGTCGGSLSGNTFTTNAVTADCTVIANFAQNAVVTHKVTPSIGTDPSWGTILPDTQQTVNDGATTQFTLAATGGYHIDTVGGTCGGSLSGNVFTTAAVTADCSVVANFAQDAVVTHKVTPSVGTDPSWGTISPDTQQTVNDGATTQFTLAATSGYHIDTVGGTCGGSLSGSVFTTAAVTADCSVIANFAADPVDPYLLYSNLGTDTGSDLLNGSTTVVGTNRYTPMVCNRLTLAQPGQQLITSFTWSSTNHNAAALTPTTSITFYDDSGASGGPGVRLGNTNGAYYSGGNYGTALNPGTNYFTGNPFGYTATYVPAPSGGGNANVWACLYYYGASASFTDAQLSNLGMEKFTNAPTSGSTTDLAFISTGAPNGGSGIWVDNPPGSLVAGTGVANVFAWELTTLGTNIMFDSYQMKNASGTAATGTIALNGATGVARNFTGYAATITAPASGNKWSVTGLQLTPLCNAVNTFNAVQAKIQFWDTFAGSTATPVFSNSAPIASVTADLDTITSVGCATATSYFILPVRLATPVTVGTGSTLGITIEYLTDKGAGLGAYGDLVSLTNSASNGYAPAVGANASTGATGWYKSASNRGDLNFQNGDYVTGTRVHIPVRVYGNQVSATGGIVPMARKMSAQGPQQQTEVASPMQDGPLSLEKQ